METASCTECLGTVEELEGWETTSGVVLCSECFSSVQGFGRAWYQGPPEVEPKVLRSEPSRMFWLTGANGEIIHTTAFEVVASPRSS